MKPLLLTNTLSISLWGRVRWKVKKIQLKANTAFRLEPDQIGPRAELAPEPGI